MEAITPFLPSEELTTALQAPQLRSWLVEHPPPCWEGNQFVQDPTPATALSLSKYLCHNGTKPNRGLLDWIRQAEGAGIALFAPYQLQRLEPPIDCTTRVLLLEIEDAVHGRELGEASEALLDRMSLELQFSTKLPLTAERVNKYDDQRLRVEVKLATDAALPTSKQWLATLQRILSARVGCSVSAVACSLQEITQETLAIDIDGAEDFQLGDAGASELATKMPPNLKVLVLKSNVTLR
ncbi:MAG TPA: hypothetical protein V6D20_15060 [Candidatus Obscuribacterales bacterium]